MNKPFPHDKVFTDEFDAYWQGAFGFTLKPGAVYSVSYEMLQQAAYGGFMCGAYKMQQEMEKQNAKG